jgi:hypothetical protein
MGVGIGIGGKGVYGGVPIRVLWFVYSSKTPTYISEGIVSCEVFDEVFELIFEVELKEVQPQIIRLKIIMQTISKLCFITKPILFLLLHID